jgi:hypothetical protein
MEEKDAQRIELWQHLINTPEIAAITVFTSHPVDAQVTSPTPKHLPLMVHTTNKFDSPQSGLTTYVYDFVPSLNFTLPGHKDYKAGPASVSHTRTLQFLKKHLNGPYFDLEAIWDEHCFYEFGERAVEKTMGTMVEEPYVNHVPTVYHARLLLITTPINRCEILDDRWHRKSSTNCILSRSFHFQ